MRFVIRNLIDDISPVPEIGMRDSLYLNLPGNGAKNSFWCRLKLRRYFPKEEGMMQDNGGRYFPQLWNQGIEPVGEPSNKT